MPNVNWVLRSNDKILPGCVYVPGYYLDSHNMYWNRKNNKTHPGTLLEEWCRLGPHRLECQQSQHVCISKGKFGLLC